jgi:uncharacterized protein YegJ (DUF2314 family)
MGNDTVDIRQHDHAEAQGVAVPRGDPDILKATQSARETLTQFIERVRSPTLGQAYQAVEIKLDVGHRAEYIWVEIDGVQDGRLLGKLPIAGNSSESDGSNTQASISPDDVHDWMIVDEGRLVGGYTLRVMYAKMDAEQRRNFDELRWYRWD